MKVREDRLGLILVRNSIGLVLLVPFGYLILYIGGSLDPKPWGYTYIRLIMVVFWVSAFVLGFAVPSVIYILRKWAGR